MLPLARAMGSCPLGLAPMNANPAGVLWRVRPEPKRRHKSQGVRKEYPAHAAIPVHREAHSARRSFVLNWLEV